MFWCFRELQMRQPKQHTSYKCTAEVKVLQIDATLLLQREGLNRSGAGIQTAAACEPKVWLWKVWEVWDV